MAESDWEHVKRIAADALEMTPQERPEFLRQACGDDAQRRAQVDALLHAHGAASGFLDAPTLNQPDQRPDDPQDRLAAGAMIGPYKVLQLIGEGGFGSVYMAEQQAPVVRRVALKIIKLGMDTRQVIARFEAERQALAMMDHPNIARVLDAGATAEGRPYFVMELVKGEPVTEYCDRNNLTISERLDLFVQVCHAVQHAHQKGVIHRDIKPTNILVSTQDGRPFAKVIDFGIAKATAARLTEKTLFTEHKALIGTPEYMSPEQAEGSLDIDTRTDVYSLGVLLYELLTGSTPFDRKSLRSAAYAEIQRIIREVEPPKPSTRLSARFPSPPGRGVRGEGEPTLAQIAAHRSMEPGRLGSLVRGDLDWIVMKSLEKDRQRRYETAHDLAADVQRHLAGEAVVAAPPSRAYRMRKFVKRHRAAVAAGLMIAIALMAGIAGTTWQAVRATNQKFRAEAAEADALEQAEIAQAVNDFLNQDLLAAVSPSAETGRGIDVTMHEVLEEASKRIEEASRPGGRFADKPLVEAAIRHTLSQTFTNLRLDDRAEPHAARAVELFRLHLGAEHPNTLSATTNLANVYAYQGRYLDAQRMHEETLALRQRVLGGDHRATLESMNNVGAVLMDRGDYGGAEKVFEEVVTASRRLYGPEDSMTLLYHGNLAGATKQQGKLAEAERLYAGALATMTRAYGPEHPATLIEMHNLAGLHLARGRFADARNLYEDVLEIEHRVLGPEHADTLESMNGLARVFLGMGEFGEARVLHENILEIRRRVLGPEHPETVTSMVNLAAAWDGEGNYAEAHRLNEEALAVARRVLGSDDPHTLLALGGLANAVYGQGNYAEAVRLHEETLEMRQRLLGPEHPDTLGSMHNLARAYAAMRQYDAAEVLYEGTLEGFQRVMDPDHPHTLMCMGNLAQVYEAQGRYGEAETLHRETLEIRQRVLGPEHPDTLNSMEQLASLLSNQSKYVDATLLREEAFEIRRRVLGPEHILTLDSMHNLANLYSRSSRYTDARRLHEEELEIVRRVQGTDHPDTLHSMNNLANALALQGNYADSQRLHEETLEILRRVQGVEHSQTLASLNNLAFVYNAQGKYSEAEPLLQEALAARVRVSGPAHADTSAVRANLIELYITQGRLDDARPLIAEQISILREIADQQSAPPMMINQLAWTLLTAEPADLRDPAAALGYAQRAVEASGGNDAGILDTLALAYHMTGDHQQAVATQEQAISLLPTGDSPLRSELEANLARFRAAAGAAQDSVPEAGTPGVDDSSR